MLRLTLYRMAREQKVPALILTLIFFYEFKLQGL